MKSKDIKNWRYDLAYSEIAELEDFSELLTDAIATDSCLLCGGDKVSKVGLCIGCSMQRENKKAVDRVSKEYKVFHTIEVVKIKK